jgi:excisionase family DNA binding protein
MHVTPSFLKKLTPPRTMSVSEVSNFLSLSATSVYRLVGELKAVRVGGRWHFRTSDVEQWLLKQRNADEHQIEPVREIGSRIRLFSHMEEGNVFLDVPDRDATTLIRNAIRRARLDLAEGADESARDRIYESIMEREALCSTALHPNVAFPASLGGPVEFPPPGRRRREGRPVGENSARALRGVPPLRPRRGRRTA